MYGTMTAELEVNAPASVVWQVYGTLKLSKIVEKQLTDVIDKIEVVQGDGSVGVSAFPYYNEKFTKVDNEKRVKETEVIEGGYLEFGFNRYSVRFEIIEKDEKSCITKSTVEYDVKEDSAANASFVSIEPLKDIMNIVAAHILVKCD